MIGRGNSINAETVQVSLTLGSGHFAMTVDYFTQKYRLNFKRTRVHPTVNLNVPPKFAESSGYIIDGTRYSDKYRIKITIYSAHFILV